MIMVDDPKDLEEYAVSLAHRLRYHADDIFVREQDAHGEWQTIPLTEATGKTVVRLVTEWLESAIVARVHNQSLVGPPYYVSEESEKYGLADQAH